MMRSSALTNGLLSPSSATLLRVSKIAIIGAGSVEFTPPKPAFGCRKTVELAEGREPPGMRPVVALEMRPSSVPHRPSRFTIDRMLHASITSSSSLTSGTDHPYVSQRPKEVVSVDGGNRRPLRVVKRSSEHRARSVLPQRKVAESLVHVRR